LEGLHLDVWLQILLISLGISIFSQLLNKIMKLDPQHMKATQARMQELSRELNASRGVGEINSQVAAGKPTRSYEEINQELMVLMKKMAKEQFLPMILRCGIFWGIFALLGAFYGQYEKGVVPFEVLFFGSGWIGAYVMFSFIISISIFGLQKLYKKLTHQEPPAAPVVPGLLGTSELALPAKSSWKERVEAAKKEFQGEERPSDSPVK
jgi:uncharacterized membrane protein (DUF106 family)